MRCERTKKFWRKNGKDIIRALLLTGGCMSLFLIGRLSNKATTVRATYHLFEYLSQANPKFKDEFMNAYEILRNMKEN